MARQAGGRRSQRCASAQKLPAPPSRIYSAQHRHMADAVRSFERLEHCAATLQSGPFGIVGGVDGIERPIVCFQVQLPVIQQWLDKLGLH